MTKDEALRLALEALEEINKLSIGENAICLPAEIDTAMDACRKVLAQPEQELVATWENKYGMKEWQVHALRAGWSLAPPQRKPLTDEEIDKLPWEPHEGNPMTFAEGLRYFARAIEAAHGIKE